MLPRNGPRKHAFRYRPSLNLSVLLLAIVFIIAAAVVVESRRLDDPLVVTELKVVAGGDRVDLVFAGTRSSRELTALLIPGPELGEDDSRQFSFHVPLFQIDSDGELAVASSRGQRLVTIDVQQGRELRILGSLEVSKPEGASTAISFLCKLGNRAVVALNRGRELALVDLTDPYAPRKLDSIRTDLDATDMLAVNGQVIAAGVRTGLWQVSVDGDRLQAVRLPGMERVWRLARAGNRLVAASLEGDLGFFDIDGTRLRMVGREHAPGGIRGVTLEQDVLHVCLDDGTLIEYAANPWPRFVERGRLPLPGRPLRLVRAPESSILVCTLVGVGAAVMDVSQAGRPSVTGWLPSGSAIIDLVINDGRILFTNNRGLQCRRLDRLAGQVNVDFPLVSHRQKVRLQSFGGEAVVYSATRISSLAQAIGNGPPAPLPEEPLLALPGDGSVRLFTRQGTGFVQVGSQPVTGPVKAVRLLGNQLFVLNEKSLEIFSCSASGTCKPRGRLEGFVHNEAFDWVEPGYLLVADRHAGLKLIAVTEADAPKLVGELPLPAFLQKTAGLQDVLVDGKRAYATRGEFGVEVIDLNHLPAMKIIQIIDTPGTARRMAMHRGMLLVADRGQGVQVIDTRRTWCRPVGTIGVASNIDDLMIRGEELLVGVNSGAVSRLPAPRPLGSLHAAGDGHGHAALPAGLPAGRYQLVLYDDRSLARADFTLD